MPADLYPYGNNPLENAQSIVTRLPVFCDFCAKNSPRRGGSVPRGIERKVFLKEAGSFFSYYNSVIYLYLLLFLLLVCVENTVFLWYSDCINVSRFKK